MPEVIVSGFVETPASLAPTPGQKEYVDGRAVIHYKSILDEADVEISATSETVGFAAENVQARHTYGGWRPSAGGTQYLTFAGTQGHYVNALTIAGHNLASKGAAIDLEYNDGAAWISALGGMIPQSDAPIMLLFSAVEHFSFRLRVDVRNADYPTIAAVLLGERLDLQRGIYVGHTPAPYSVDVDFVTEESEGGNNIGSVVLSEAFTTSIDFKRITPTWFRNYMKAFLVQARRRVPFGFMWKTDDRYKGEVIFGVMTNKPDFGNEHQSFMNGTIAMRGHA